MRFVPGLAVLVTGLALFASRAVLDQILTPNGPARVALLPAWQTIGGFVGLAALGLLWLDRRAVPRGTTVPVRRTLGPLVLPALGLSVLLLPFLPVIADALPALQMLAGPLRSVIWLVIVMQLVWVLWQARLVRADWLQRWTLKRAAAAIGLLTVVASGLAAARLTGTPLYPAGDEPHYLIIAQSLWRDRDLKIENNHTRRDYAEYFPLDLDPHHLARGADGEIYSIHPIGMPVVIAPVFAAFGYRGVVWFFVLTAGVAAALMWHAVVRVTNAIGAATFAWAAVAATTPFLFNSFAVYPEIPAALAAVIALTVIFGGAGPREPLTRWLIVGIACATLPWLSTKYAPMSAVLVAIAVARVLVPTASGKPSPVSGLRPTAPGTRHPALAAAPTIAALVVPYGASLLAWFSFFYATWGTPLPQAPYGAMVQTDLRNLVFGAPGLLFDQEYGLLPYAPVYALAATGLWQMWRDGGGMRRRAIEVALVFSALLATVGAYRIWWGGSASPGRPLTSSLPLLMLPIAMAFRSAPAGSARRAAHHLLLWISIGIAIVALVAQRGFLLANRRDGTSNLLEYISAWWPAWTIAPSFIYHEAPEALLHTAVWLLVATLAAYTLSRVRTAHPGVASLAAIGTCFAAIVVGAVVVPQLPATPPWPSLDMRSRPRLPVLDAFDVVTRPVGIEYTPLRIVAAGDVFRRASLSVEPGSRLDPQPVRVLHNGRFSLPAGRFRMEVEWKGARTGETLGLQIGRTGDAWRTWSVEPRPGERWTTEFDLPVDASFVGLRGTPELEQVVGRIVILPLAIVNAADRPKVPPIIGASQHGEVAAFYYDNASPEPAGFWIFGRGRRTRVSIHRPRFEAPLVLRVHSGLIANRFHLSTGGWSHTMDLKPELPERIEIPSSTRALVTLDMMAEHAFVPKELDASSRDARSLGIWVEVIRP